MTTWDQSDDEWIYELFEPGGLPDGHSALAEFVSLTALWHSKRDDRDYPAWSDFQLSDFSQWWGRLAVYDVVDLDQGTYRVRLWGTALAEFYQTDVTGKTMQRGGTPEINGPLGTTDVDYAFFSVVVSDGLVGMLRGPMYWQNRSYRHYTLLLLPLASNRIRPDGLLVAIGGL